MPVDCDIIFMESCFLPCDAAVKALDAMFDSVLEFFYIVKVVVITSEQWHSDGFALVGRKTKSSMNLFEQGGKTRVVLVSVHSVYSPFNLCVRHHYKFQIPGCLPYLYSDRTIRFWETIFIPLVI